MLDMYKVISHRVPAKVILLGEHFVVHGSRAISASVDLFVEGRLIDKESDYLLLKYLDHSEKISYDSGNVIIEFIKYLLNSWRVDTTPKIEIEFSFPTSAGLGSSAALGALIVYLIYSWWFGKDPDKDLIYLYGGKFEEMIHGTPSGIDLTTVVEGGIILFKKGRGVLDKIDEDVFKDVSIIIIDSKLRRSTGQLVSKVTRYLKELDGDIRNSLITIVDEIVSYGWKSLKNIDLKSFYSAMSANHYLLKYIGVYRERLDKIIHNFMNKGGYVAKVTGAGGGGCIVGFADTDISSELINFFRKRGYPVYAPKIYFGRDIS